MLKPIMIVMGIVLHSTDCPGICGGSTVLDDCGVCGGNGQSCCSLSLYGCEPNELVLVQSYTFDDKFQYNLTATNTGTKVITGAMWKVFFE